VLHDGRMNEVVLDSDGGRHLTLRRRTWPDEESFESMDVMLGTPEGEMATRVWDYRSSLAPFFVDLASSWRGFDGAKEYQSVEGELLLVCTHDGLGSVRCEATLRRPAPPEWALSVTLTWGAGAHLQQLAADVKQFCTFP